VKILVGCEFSGIVRDAFAARGHDAWSCDLLPTESPGQHIQGDVLEHLNDEWDMMIAHPPCTYLTNAGVRHLHMSTKYRNGVRTAIFGEARWVECIRAAKFFNKLLHAPIPLIAVENPIPHGYARDLIGRYTQLIQPWQFGHGETKATCLWLKNLSPLQPTKIMQERRPMCHHCPEGPERWRIRSRTYEGIASAMASQWG